jgi:2-polyprenyl-3-methyl-5-hydroxy-6-metoxy-1,4-benzoquinol methylase
MLKAGYKNAILTDTMLKSEAPIHIGYGTALFKDIDYFCEDWGIHYMNVTPNNTAIKLIEGDGETINNILEVGSNVGHTLMALKNKYPKASLYAMDINPNAIEIAKCFTNAKSCDVEKDGIPFSGVKFDVIIIADVLEHLRDPESVLKLCRDYLSDNGQIIISVPNIQNISVINQLLHGRFTYTDVGLLDKTHIHFFTGIEISLMVERAGYITDKALSAHMPMSEDESNTYDKLKNVFPNLDDQGFMTFQYMFRIKKKGAN